MKIKISNLGAIEQAEINLKPLTIFVGANSTGKTWTAYTLASIFGQHGLEKYIKAFNNNKTHVKYESLENAVDTFLQLGSTQLDLIEFTNNYAEKYINDVSRLAPDWMSEYLNTERINFENLQINIDLSESKNDIFSKIKKYSLDKQVSFGSKFVVKIIKQQGEKDIYFFIIYEGDSKKIPKVEDINRKQQALENSKIQEYIDLAQMLEHNILYGNINIDSSKLQNEIIFHPLNGASLEMQVSSSMVKELVPLLLCLRYLAEPNDLLIIDEPEMNLHPSVQVQIIEFLAMLVNAGLNILITTHSAYIIDHLSNLIKATKSDNRENLKNKFYLENTQAFISQEKVSIYLFEDNTTKNILAEDGHIDWRTFGDVSEDISHVFM